MDPKSLPKLKHVAFAGGSALCSRCAKMAVIVVKEEPLCAVHAREMARSLIDQVKATAATVKVS